MVGIKKMDDKEFNSTVMFRATTEQDGISPTNNTNKPVEKVKKSLWKALVPYFTGVVLFSLVTWFGFSLDTIVEMVFSGP
jgi:hypothetical protein